MIDVFGGAIILSPTQRQILEQLTRGQAESQAWKDQCLVWITATKCMTVNKVVELMRKKKQTRTTLAKELVTGGPALPKVHITSFVLQVFEHELKGNSVSET